MKGFSLGLLSAYCAHLKQRQTFSDDGNSNKRVLRFNKDRKFKIVQLTDVHLGINEEKDE